MDPCLLFIKCLLIILSETGKGGNNILIPCLGYGRLTDASLYVRYSDSRGLQKYSSRAACVSSILFEVERSGGLFYSKVQIELLLKRGVALLYSLYLLWNITRRLDKMNLLM